MDDLISRQAAIEAMREMYHAAEKWGEKASEDMIKARAESCMASLIEMKLRIENLPSAVVRCGECKWCIAEEYGKECENPNANVVGYVDDLDYCSFGERKDNG